MLQPSPQPMHPNRQLTEPRAKTLEALGQSRLVAAVRTQGPAQALAVAEAVAAGGCSLVEVSLAVPGWADVLRDLSRHRDLIGGAGGLASVAQAQEAIEAGAHFIGTSMTLPEIVPVCHAAHVVVALGALTPSEIHTAAASGADLIRIYPAEALGGVPYVRRILEEFPGLRIMVAGDITEETLRAYLDLPVSAILVGSLLAPPRQIDRGRYAPITEQAMRLTALSQRRRQRDLGAAPAT